MRGRELLVERGWGPRRSALLTVLTAVALGAPGVGVAEEDGGEPGLVGALIGGTVKLDVRARGEFADQTGSGRSEAFTVRTRLGYGTAKWHGASVYGEFENVASPNNAGYFDGIAPNSRGKTAIADPEVTQFNQGYLRLEDLPLGTGITVGRKRIILDDARFIGNVGWRQNEQTYDSALLDSSFGVDSLKVTYAYLWDVNRIFGVTEHANTRGDFHSDSHLVNLNYSGLSLPGASKDAKINLGAFAYILDFKNSLVNSSNSFGFRATGRIPVDGDWNAGYGLSYAHQVDGGDNATNYNANYVWAEGALGYAPCGTLKLGYELLGSDDGAARFVTPLATAHKFNGWADVFLDNGGAAGLQDIYVGFAPKLPWKLKGKLVYHHFKSHNGGDRLGNEIDGDLTRPFLKHFLGRLKFAYFNGEHASMPNDLYRVWLELTFRFSAGG